MHGMKRHPKESHDMSDPAGSKPLGVPGGLTVDIVQSFGELKAYASRWDELAFAAPQQQPMLSHAWISSYLQHRLNPGEQWCCLFACHGSRLVGVLPLLISRRSTWGIGYTLFRTPSDDHTISVDAIVAPGEDAAIVESMIASLTRVTSARYVVELLRLPSSSPTLAVMRRGPKQNYTVMGSAGVGSYLPTTGSFEEFRASLSGSFRRTLNRAAKKLDLMKDLRAEFLIGKDATAEGLDRFAKIEALSWKGRAGSAIMQTEALLDFYRTLTSRLAERDWLEWQFLIAEGRTIAGIMAIRCGRSLMLWKIGYDEAYKDYSPGALLLEQVVRRACESSHIDEINLVTDMDWYDLWRAGKREHYDVWVYSRNPLNLLTGVLPRRLRLWLRRVPVLRTAVQRVRRLTGRDKA